MFFEGIRSERQLVRLAADRLSVRWYLGYNLDEPLPDHSSLTRIRARYGLEVFRRFFEAIVAQCQQAGLVWGHELYFDATQVQANAALDSLTARFAVEAREASHAHLATLFANDTGQAAYEEVDAAPGAVLAEDSRTDDPTVSPLETPLPVDLPATLREELAQANAARHDWIA
jgi:IS5 family transposase